MISSPLLSTTFWVFLISFTAAAYVFGAYILYRIGRKFGIGSFGEYCIPIYNGVLICRCAGISPWLVLLGFVPIANLVFMVYLFGTLAQKMGHDFWSFGLGMFLFGIPALVLAFYDTGPADTSGPGPAGSSGTGTERVSDIGAAAIPAILCISGEFSGGSFPIDRTGLVIGRSPDKSNLVLSSREVSAAHARVWSDIDGGVWVEDLRSSNGTYYCQPGPGKPEWIRIREVMSLASGMHFRLGDGVIEFVVT